MRRIIYIFNLVLICFLCCSCGGKVEESEPGHNHITQQELQEKHNDMVSELVVDFTEKYNKTQNDNYVFSGLSFYNSIQIMKYISEREKSEGYGQIVGNDYSIYRDGAF